MQGYDRKIAALMMAALIVMPMLAVFACPCYQSCSVCGTENSSKTETTGCCSASAETIHAAAAKTCCVESAPEPVEQKTSACIHAIGDNATMDGIVQVAESLEAPSLSTASFVSTPVNTSKEDVNVFFANDLSPPSHPCSQAIFCLFLC